MKQALLLALFVGVAANADTIQPAEKLSFGFLEADLVDEVQLFQSPTIIGPQGIDAIADTPLLTLDERFKLTQKEVLGTDTLTVYERPHVYRNSH